MAAFGKNGESRENGSPEKRGKIFFGRSFRFPLRSFYPADRPFHRVAGSDGAGAGLIFVTKRKTKKSNVMKKRSRILGAAAVLLLAATTLWAQGPRGGRENMTPRQRAERMATRMSEQLSLSKEQTAEIERILTDRFDRRPKKDSAACRCQSDSLCRKPNGPARRGPRPDRDAMRETDSLIRSVLTEEQVEKWQEIRKQARPVHGQRPGPRPDAGNRR